MSGACAYMCASCTSVKIEYLRDGMCSTDSVHSFLACGHHICAVCVAKAKKYTDFEANTMGACVACCGKTE